MPDPDPAPRAGSPRPPGTLRLGSIAGAEVRVSSTWFVLAALIAVVMAPAVDRIQPGLGPGVYLAGLGIAVLLYLAVLLHEASHAVAARLYGFQVESITLHFLGGMTSVRGEARTPRQEFVIAVVGPLTSLAIGLAALGLAQPMPPGLPAFAVTVLAWANLLIGVLNLVPGLPLDGGRVLKSLVWRLSGDVHRGTIAAGWGGRVTAVLALSWPLAQEAVLGQPADLLDVALAFVVALFLWVGASAAIASGRVRRRLPGLVARDLARRTLAVPDDLPLAEAVRRAREAQAGSLVTLSATGEPLGVVNERALLAVPEERRPWVPVSSVARSIGSGLALPVGLRGEDLVAALQGTPAHEYVLLEDDGTIYGVLAAADVDRAFRDG